MRAHSPAPQRRPAGADTASAWRAGSLHDTMFLQADYRQQRFPPHFHEEFAIGLIDGGCQAFLYDRARRLDMPAGSVALITPGIVHSGWPGAACGWRYRMLYPSRALVGEALADILGREVQTSFDRPVVADADLAGRLARLHACSAEPHCDRLELEARFLAAIGMAFTRHAGVREADPARPHRPGLLAVREALHTRSAEALRLDELARLAGLSRFTLVRQFKATFGLPPHAYLRQLRVRRAAALIARGHALADAALAAGFADQAHMTRIFRSILGVTPGALARRL